VNLFLKSSSKEAKYTNRCKNSFCYGATQINSEKMKIAFKFLLALIFATLFLYSCQKEEFITDSTAILEFSTDTVMFDTVFTSIGTVTKYLKVYNRYDKSINIASIRLADNTKNYRLNIDGFAGNIKQDVVIAPHDSIFIFIEITIDPNNINTPMVVQDSILFTANGNQQDIDLVAWGQNVHILKDYEITQHTTWTADKPYLVYNYVFVDSTASLTIEKGTKIYFHDLAQIIALGNLTVKGTIDEPVVFDDDRLDEWYDVSPGYWAGILLLGSGNRYHSFDNVVINNAINGIEAYYLPNSGSSVRLNNVTISNMSRFGIVGFEAAISATNSLITNCGLVSFYVAKGGNYEFYNCTFANYYGANDCPVCSPRTYPSLLITNYFDDEKLGILPATTTNVYFYNSIIYGSNETELVFDFIPNIDANYLFENCILKADKTINTNDTEHYKNILKNPTEQVFEDPWKMNFELDSLSPAINKGDVRLVKVLRQLLEYDMKGNSRLADVAPDLGAFERVEKNKRSSTLRVR